MRNQWRSHLYVLLRTPSAILLLLVTLICSFLLFNDMGEVMRDVGDLERFIRRCAAEGRDGIASLQNMYDLPGTTDLEEIFAAVKRYQIAGAPYQAASGMFLLLFILPGINFSSGLTRSLGIGAPVLLADEPTGNLDGANTVNVIRSLGQLAHEQGCCVIVVTHDPEAADTTDPVLRMKDRVLTAA